MQRARHRLKAVHDGFLDRWAVVDEISTVWRWCASEAECAAVIARYEGGADIAVDEIP